MMEDVLSAVLFFVGGLIAGIVSGQVLLLRPKSLIKRTPAAIKSAELIIAFISEVLLLAYVVSSTLVPIIVASPGILSILALFGLTLLVGFGLPSLLSIGKLYDRIAKFVRYS